MKPVDVKPNKYNWSSKEFNDEDPKFEYQNITTFFAKCYVPIWSEEVFVIRKVKNAVPWTYVISDLKGEETFGRFYERTAKNKPRIV